MSDFAVSNDIKNFLNASDAFNSRQALKTFVPSIIEVNDDFKRFELTSNDVSIHNIVYVVSTGMYHYVIDTDNLDNGDGYSGIGPAGTAIITVVRGNREELSTIVLKPGELAYATDEKQIYIGDGVTLGGIVPIISKDVFRDKVSDYYLPDGYGRFVTTSSFSPFTFTLKSSTGRVAVQWWDGVVTIYTNGNNPANIITCTKAVNQSNNQTYARSALKPVVFWSCTSSTDATKSGNITYLSPNGRNIISLDVSKLTALIELNCSINQLTSLDLSNNVALTTLTCSNNQLTSLDLSNNVALTTLSCNSNQLTSLDLSNNVALTYLSCDSNQLTSLDVSNNVALTFLNCSSNQLTSLESLDLSNNVALTTLTCSNNQLTSLDVSNNVALTTLTCSNNQLTSLDLSNNIALTSLTCNSNQLTSLESLDLSNNVALTSLICSSNQLTSLDVSNNFALRSLNCNSNQLTSLDVSNNVALTFLNCSSNQLTSLDLSNNIALTELTCSSNQLTSLDLSNNVALDDDVSVRNNPLLQYVNISNLSIFNSEQIRFNSCTSLSTVVAENFTTTSPLNFSNCNLTTDAVYTMVDGMISLDSINLSNNPCDGGIVLNDGITYRGDQTTDLIIFKGGTLII